MSKEYIERDCFKCFHYPVCEGDTDTHNYFGECNHFISVADVLPVKQGKWIENESFNEETGEYEFCYTTCNQCNYTEINYTPKYCPKCGAEMINGED